MIKLLISALVTLFIASISHARNLTYEEQQIFHSSISAVSIRFDIPLVVLYGVYLQEKGWPGLSQEVNGSADLGIFQINTHPDNWMPILNSELGIGHEAIQYSIAANTIAAGYILSIEYQRAGTWTEAIGNYHRHARDSFRNDYQSRVVSHMMKLLKSNPGLVNVGSPWVEPDSGLSTAQVTIE